MTLSHPGEKDEGEYGPFPGSLSLVIVREGARIVCFARGSMDSAHGEMLRRKLVELAAEAVDALVIDMESVEFLGSAGLTAVLAARSVAEERGCRVVVRRIPAHARSLLEMAGLVEALGL